MLWKSLCGIMRVNLKGMGSMASIKYPKYFGYFIPIFQPSSHLPMDYMLPIGMWKSYERVDTPPPGVHRPGARRWKIRYVSSSHDFPVCLDVGSTIVVKKPVAASIGEEGLIKGTYEVIDVGIYFYEDSSGDIDETLEPIRTFNMFDPPKHGYPIRSLLTVGSVVKNKDDVRHDRCGLMAYKLQRLTSSGGISKRTPVKYFPAFFMDSLLFDMEQPDGIKYCNFHEGVCGFDYPRYHRRNSGPKTPAPTIDPALDRMISMLKDAD